MQKHHADELMLGQSLGTKIKVMQNLFDWQRLQVNKIFVNINRCFNVVL